MEWSMPNLRLVTWNIGGAKFLREKKPVQNALRTRINQGLTELIQKHQPDLILLQETVRYGHSEHPTDFIRPPAGYYYDVSVAIDTLMQTHPSKWSTYRSGGHWSQKDYLAQGLGMLWKKDMAHAPIWEFRGIAGPVIEKEIVRLETGLYTGDRDTEPRLAVVTHFMISNKDQLRDIFIVHLHLSTLKGEREKFPRMDDLGSRTRLEQIEVILNGIVSRYEEWRLQTGYDEKKPSALWILAGDFNCTPDSPEIQKIERMNFIDMNPDKGQGSKGQGFPENRAEITVDYIFAGPRHHVFETKSLQTVIQNNSTPLYHLTGSDHYPVLAEVPV